MLKSLKEVLLNCLGFGLLIVERSGIKPSVWGKLGFSLSQSVKERETVWELYCLNPFLMGWWGLAQVESVGTFPVRLWYCERCAIEPMFHPQAIVEENLHVDRF